MEKDEMLEILDVIIKSLRENPNQLNYKEINITGFQSEARGRGIGTQVISNAPGAPGMEITVLAGDINTSDIHDTSNQNQAIINKEVNILEEFKNEISKEKPNTAILENIQDRGEQILMPVISAILTKILFYLMKNIA
ncbi:MAG: hypothetical protein PVF58_15440 [Candidatus Methanofastidiosia archaeon]|jgi:hypothetical protein